MFDFDGTLWRGDEPLLHYAQLVSEELPSGERLPFQAALRALLHGERWAVTGLNAPPHDGWAAVAELARARGGSERHRQEAFAETRRRIAAGDFQLEVPAGLTEFLAFSRTCCTVVLASNSPAESVQPVVERLGLVGYLDDIASDASKPGRFLELVDGWISVLRPDHVMSVGDHYRNDIEPAAGRGWFTTYINPWRWIPGSCSIAGATVEEVLPQLYGWVRAVERSAADRRGGLPVGSGSADSPAPGGTGKEGAASSVGSTRDDPCV